MLKNKKHKILSVILLIIVLIMSSSPVSAQSFGNVDYNVEYEIINNTTLYNESENSFYGFDNELDMTSFLSSLNYHNTTILNTCFPGDPGYPTCQSNPIVGSESTYVSHYYSGYLVHSKLLLGSAGWVFGGAYGASMTYNSSTTLTYTYDGVSFSKNIGQSSTFPVPAWKKGNIKYQSKWKIETRQLWHILKDGSRINNIQYKVSTFIDGGHVGVYQSY